MIISPLYVQAYQLNVTFSSISGEGSLATPLSQILVVTAHLLPASNIYTARVGDQARGIQWKN